MTSKADHQLDITQEVCPITFVKAKLAVERMAPGEVIEIRLLGNEPLQNVPRSLGDLGHRILHIGVAADDPKGEVHVMRVEKVG